MVDDVGSAVTATTRGRKASESEKATDTVSRGTNMKMLRNRDDVEVDAFQYTGENHAELLKFQRPGDPPFNFGIPAFSRPIRFRSKDQEQQTCQSGDWIVREPGTPLYARSHSSFTAHFRAPGPVARFSLVICHTGAEYRCSPEGEWVLYPAYDRVEKRVATLKTENARLQADADAVRALIVGQGHRDTHDTLAALVRCELDRWPQRVIEHGETERERDALRTRVAELEAEHARWNADRKAFDTMNIDTFRLLAPQPPFDSYGVRLSNEQATSLLADINATQGELEHWSLEASLQADRAKHAHARIAELERVAPLAEDAELTDEDVTALVMLWEKLDGQDLDVVMRALAAKLHSLRPVRAVSTPTPHTP